DLFESLKKEDPEIVIFKAAKIIVAMQEGTSMKDVTHLLKTDLKIHQKMASELAHDIKNTVAVLAADEAEEEVDFQKELLQKIQGNRKPAPVEPEEPVTPN